jgi:putative two-component system response regulator
MKNIQIDILTNSGKEKVAEISSSVVQGTHGGRMCEIILRDITEKAAIERLKQDYLKTLEDEIVKRTSEIKDVQRASILAIAALAESIDNYTFRHLERIRRYSKVLAEELRSNPRYQEVINDDYIEMIYDLSPLHDIGKVGIRDIILQKDGKLTEAEYEKVKIHTEIGAKALQVAGQLIKRGAIFAIAEMIARFHHQRWDGKGYPAVHINNEYRPLKGEEIPLCARITTLADVYDALTSERPYKDAYPHEITKKIIVAESGRHFDPDIVDAFLKREQDFIRIREEFPDQQTKKADKIRFSLRDLEEANF